MEAFEVLTTCTDKNAGKPMDCGDLMIDEVLPSKSIMPHENSIDALCLHPKKDTEFASGSHDSTIMLWDSGTIRSKSTLRGHEKGVWSLAYNPEGSMLVSSSPDTTARIWDCKSGKTAATLKGHDLFVSTHIF